jgi:hypothetical protein
VEPQKRGGVEERNGDTGSTRKQRERAAIAGSPGGAGACVLDEHTGCCYVDGKT